MSIVALKKLTLFGVIKDKTSTLASLQELGCLHIVPLVPPPKEVEDIVPAQADRAHKAIRFLGKSKTLRKQVSNSSDFRMDEVVDKALSLQLDIRRASDRIELLEQRLECLEPWGDIQYPPHEKLVGYRLWYYILPLAKKDALFDLDLPWQIMHQDTRFAYLVLISQDEPAADILPVARSHVGSLPKCEVAQQLEDNHVLLEELQGKREALTRYIYLMNVNLAEADDHAALAHVAQQTLDDDRVMALQAWVPETQQKMIRAFCEQKGLACCIEAPGKGETPPTLLDQPPELESAADLAMFYQTPGYFGWDPSRLLFASFSVFFAMILADAGYGLLLLFALLGFWRKLGQSSRARSYRLLALSLCLCTVVYGAMVGSYFGMAPPEPSLLNHFYLFSVSDFDVMMKLSIIVGVVHISIANLSMAYVLRHSGEALSKLGWLALIWGGLLYWLAGASAFGLSFSYGLLGLGALLVILFTSTRPLSSPKDALLRIVDGLFSLKNLLNAFGDILSYMRLFALGLASASLAITFNNLARDVHDSVAGGGLLLAILILLIGHGLNLLLALMSGVVHGLRLNFIEFYNWGQTEEGTAFQRFARKEIEK